MVEQTFSFECYGRDGSKIRRPVLEEPAEVKVKVQQFGEDNPKISSVVDCRYIAGAERNICKASGEGDVVCPYNFNLPETIDRLMIDRTSMKEGLKNLIDNHC